MIHDLDPLLTEKDLSAWLGISLPSLQRMRSNGGGPYFVRLSERRVGYRKADVEVWLVSRTTDHIDRDLPAAANWGQRQTTTLACQSSTEDDQ